jgi:hypothetical protein
MDVFIGLTLTTGGCKRVKAAEASWSEDSEDLGINEKVNAIEDH